MRKNNQQKQPYKIAFFSLLGVIIAGFVIMIGLMFAGSRTPVSSTTDNSSRQAVDITLNKNQVNDLADFYLDKIQKEQSGSIKYRFQVKDDGIVYGKLKLLGADVPYALSFTPKVTKSGNVELDANKLSIGRQRLPLRLVLLYVKSSYHLPQWVSIDPAAKKINLNITSLNGAEGINFKATKIDMAGNGKFKLKILLPKE